MMSDGRKQRNALTSAEQALRALAAGQGGRAFKNAAQAANLDQIGAHVGLREAVALAVDDIDNAGVVSVDSWERLKGIVGIGPLRSLIDEALER